MTIIKQATLFALIFVLSSCGMANKHKAALINEDYKQGNFCKAAEDSLSESEVCTLEKIEELDEELLDSLNGGSALFANKQFVVSNQLFESSDKKIKEHLAKYLAGSTKTLAASLANESILDYSPMIADNLYLSSYKILNALALNDKAKARVEVKRGYEKQQEASKIFKKQIEVAKTKAAEESSEKQSFGQSSAQLDNKTASILNNYSSQYSRWNAYKDYMNPYTTYLSGLFLLNNANGMSDLETSLTYLKRAKGMAPKNKTVENDYLLAKNKINGRASKKNKYSWVIFENGMATDFKEKRFDIPVWVAYNRVQWVSFSIATPNERRQAYDDLELSFSKKGKVYHTQTLMDVDKTIISEYNKLFPSLLSRAITATVSKAILQYTMSKNGSGAGLIAGIYAMATTSADLRSWHTLPKNVQVARVKVEKGKKLSIFAQHNKLLEVDVPADSNSIVYIRIPSKTSKPAVSVIKI